MQQMIRADGGSGKYEERALPMLGIWNTLLEVSKERARQDRVARTITFCLLGRIEFLHRNSA